MLRLGGRQTWSLSTATCKNVHSTHSLAYASQLRARARPQSFVHSINRNESLAVYSSYRLYSSLPPAPETHSRTTKVEPVFASPTSRKPKVELKPGPRPVNSLNPPSDGVHPPSHVGAGKPVAAAPQPVVNFAQPKAEATKSDEVSTTSPPSKIKMAIADVVKAAEQGTLAPPPKDASKVGKLWHQVKELFKFYVRGLKRLVTHRQIVKDIEARVREEKAQGVTSVMTWEETHFIKTYKEDLVKLIPFLLILLILEEALPLVVLYAPFLLPSTCILPNQRARIIWKRDDAQYDARLEARRILSEAGPLSSSIGAGVSGMPSELVTALAKVFGLSTRGPVMLHRKRLEKHLAYLVSDDRLLVDESMGSHLDLRSLRNAISERGFLASADESQLRTTLEKRLKALGQDAAQWKSASLEFLFTDLLESNKDVRPTPVD